MPIFHRYASRTIASEIPLPELPAADLPIVQSLHVALSDTAVIPATTDLNWQHSFLDLPDTKGGQLKVPVSAHVLGLLKHIHDKTGSPCSGYVLRGPKGTRIKSINRSWENVRAAVD